MEKDIENINVDQNQEEQKQEKKNKHKTAKRITIITIIIIIILLLLRSCGAGTGTNEVVDNTPVGNFVVQTEQEEKPVVEEVKEKVPDITFAGYGRYRVSAKAPNIELTNPAANAGIADFVFTLKDKETGEVIARTDKVTAGNYVYVNVIDFYGVEPGSHFVDIVISTSHPETGSGLNGLNQSMEIIIE